MRLYHFVVLGSAVAIVSTGCDPLGSSPTSAGQDSAGGAQGSASAPQEFDYIGTRAAGPFAWFGDGSKLLVVGETSAISGGGVVALAPLAFVPPTGSPSVTAKTLTAPILSVACEQSTNCYADLIDGRILRVSVAGDTAEIAPPGAHQFIASDNGLFIARPRLDSTGIEVIDVKTKGRVTFEGSAQTPLLGISPDGRIAVEVAGTGVTQVNVITGTSTSASLPQHTGWVQNSIVAARW